ncbi:hypothetical protein C6I20_01240 [Aeromicrobium sp. A1-2]|uniref:DUF4190 domain-containing protein n=1 Tax=Aeromicrobium sp. A1-2 TaxID=2107713 RepID=UPI000E4EAD52|nr:DUF4190 domain-containing protein [Aeromicrobium sp. A1-2]AXT83946.1 hypothetical protein C6I20_01240 [Aeromicrobium sp. A1-2]
MTSPYAYPSVYPAPPPLPRPHPKATTALVLGILGVAGFFVLVVPVAVCPLAWYYGAVARREAEREPTRWDSGGAAKAGLVLGIIGTVLLGVLLLLLLVVASLALLVSRYDAGYGT